MPNRFLRSRPCCIASIVLLFLSWSGATAETLRFNPVSRAVVEARLGKYSGNDGQRAAALKQMFDEAGCDDQHLSEQPVKESKLPNVVTTCFSSDQSTLRNILEIALESSTE